MTAPHTAAERAFAVEYVLPLRWEHDDGIDELGEYLRRLNAWVDVTIVDGSPPHRYEAHRRAWPEVRHLPPAVPGLNGKARGAMTGIQAARHDLVIVADDDVRYSYEALRALIDRMAGADLVRPQNVFEPMPWHARWDTGRTLINRAFGGDYSGTLALRRNALPPEGYDTDVLFENLELERTVRACGGRVRIARDIYIARRPPTAARFLEQRVRQAYDSLGQPARSLAELSLLPVAVWAFRRPARRLSVIVTATVAIAAWGRYRDRGAAHFPASAVLWAPLWVAERALTAWTVPLVRMRGGVRYRDTRITTAAHSTRRLTRHCKEARS
ncbi:glycosyltransferase [Sediminivirga luteola]|uniref:Glycosyl transferase family 2 n=1 Tax=Sediminivirga luteola TaxID=1774748 RepID=A0A8J2TZQ6_9MICO|nr:glycosyltransferase family 2 protein [Sediminivirga luteola]MCI2266900.1 glycosyltransferase family 2 protein [Sediminivirga luteola]GGA21340.1 hypothetical protein GCM10011333_25580 [Sediminivirga luteola]